MAVIETMNEVAALNQPPKNVPSIYLDRLEYLKPSGTRLLELLLKTLFVNKLIKGNWRVIFVLGEVLSTFSLLDKKSDDHKRKHELSRKLYMEIFNALGMELNSGKIDIVWQTKDLVRHSDQYWAIVLNIACQEEDLIRRLLRQNKNTGKERVKILNFLMQCADIIFFKADVCHSCGEIDDVVARYCQNVGKKVPMFISHYKFPDLLNLSLSKTFLLLDDDEMDLLYKILKSYLPLNKETQCAVLQYAKHIVFPWFGQLTVSNEQNEFIVYKDFEDLLWDVSFDFGAVRWTSVKFAIARALNRIMQLVRLHLAKPEVQKLLCWLNLHNYQGLLAPRKLNWEKLGIFSEFRKQTRSVCWCFAICDYLEAKYFKDHRRRIRVARQELIDNLGSEEFDDQPYPYSICGALSWIEANGLSLETHYPPFTGVKHRPFPKQELVPFLKIKGVTSRRECGDLRTYIQYQPVLGTIRVNEGAIDYKTASLPYVFYTNRKERDTGHALVIKGWDEWDSPNPSHLVRDPSAVLKYVKRSNFLPHESNALCGIDFCDHCYVDFLQKPGKFKGD